jgi:hypothetical protein
VQDARHPANKRGALLRIQQINMNRKIFITIGSIIIVVLLGIAVWYLFFIRTTQTPIHTPPAGSPFGEGSGTVVPADNTLTGGTTSGTSANKLFRLTDTPVAGFVTFSIRKDSPTLVRYADRATGHIYDINPFTLEKTKITNNTVPKIIEAHFKNDGSGVLLRSIREGDTITNISLTLTPPKSTSTNLYAVSATNLRGDMDDVAVGPANSLVYVLLDTKSINTSLFDGSNAKQILSSAFTNWKVRWDNQTNISLVTKASRNISGFAYLLNPSNGRMTKILGPLNGLVALMSPDTRHVVYSYVTAGRTVLSVQEIASDTATDILPATFADKCVWSRQGIAIICGTPSSIGTGEPDNWYKGLTHFSDQIWHFNILTGTSELLTESNTNANIDVWNPSISPAEDYLFFINKNDLTLWALKLR